jgi:hypothetical protein
MQTVLDAFIMTDSSYKEARETLAGSPSDVDKSPMAIFSKADGLASSAGEKLKPLLEERYAPAKYADASKNIEEPGGMGGLNSMYQGQGPAWYGYYRRIEAEMAKNSTKQKTAGRRRKTKKSKRRARKTRRRHK